MAQLRKMDLNELRLALWCNTYHAIGLDANMTILVMGLITKQYHANVRPCRPDAPDRIDCLHPVIFRSSA
jgi:hypothetical protein